jgi:hypothetical protein
MLSENRRAPSAAKSNPIRIGILGAVLALASACNKQNEAKAGAAGPAPLVIGLSLADLKEERWQRDRDFFVAKAKELGAEVIVQDATASCPRGSRPWSWCPRTPMPPGPSSSTRMPKA